MALGKKPATKQKEVKVLPQVISVVEALRARGETVGFAESCTGGLLSSAITKMAGSSSVFMGSVVAYSYEIKERLLGVPAHVLRSLGAVSVPVARYMAEGARKNLHVTWAVSITGIAGPGGGTPSKPVGTVCFGICGPGVDRVEQRWFPGNRREVQIASAKFALELLLLELRGEALK